MLVKGVQCKLLSWIYMCKVLDYKNGIHKFLAERAQQSVRRRGDHREKVL